MTNEELAREAARLASIAISGRDGYADRLEVSILQAITSAVEARDKALQPDIERAVGCGADSYPIEHAIRVIADRVERLRSELREAKAAVEAARAEERSEILRIAWDVLHACQEIECCAEGRDIIEAIVARGKETA